MLTENPGLIDRFSNWVSSSITLKMTVIGIIILLLLIPASMVQTTVFERNSLKNNAVDEISGKWGGIQTITGPVLTVPYKIEMADIDDKKYFRTAYTHFLPDKFNVEGTIKPEIRYRGIYKAVLYNSEIALSGAFSAPDFEKFNIPSEHVCYDDAFLSIGISDMRGVPKSINITYDTKTFDAEPGIPVKEVIQSGVNIPVTIPSKYIAGTQQQFSCTLNINGSKSINFVPVGKETSVKINSPWDSPSFNGAFLPFKRTIDNKGFEAFWNILQLNRNYPQSWTGNSFQLEPSAFGVSMFLPVDEYQLITRAVKYALLFIALTFAFFFMIEIMKKIRPHPIQYTLIGLALILFYSLLLSLSEPFGFTMAYVIASFCIVAMITLYALTIFRKHILAVILGVTLSVLYGCLYIILQLEDYALLMGSILLFCTLGIFMYLTRNINWYALSKPFKRVAADEMNGIQLDKL